MKNKTSLRWLTLLCCLIAMHAEAKIKLPSIISDNMVLQQNTQARLWGWADPNEKVKISPSWTSKQTQTQANQDGYWEAYLQTPTAGGPYSIRIEEKEKIELNNILIGEVWLCSGQSNMEMDMRGYPGQLVEGNQQKIVQAKAKRPIRAFTVKKKISSTPEQDCIGAWDMHQPEAVGRISATAYFFADFLQETLDIPVGIIVSSWGGTKVEAWMRPQEVEKYKQIDQSHYGKPAKTKNANQASVLYHGMLSPIKNYTIKGAIWYQGESNRYDAKLYQDLLPDFVAGLRDLWQVGEFPFYYVQIAPFGYQNPDDTDSALLREAQLNAEKIIPNSGMAVTLDIGERYCIHPPKKKEVGQRLAFWALRDTYDQYVPACEGPRLKAMEIKGDKALLTFEGVVQFPNPINEPLEFFEVAGEDKVFYPARAVVNTGVGKLEISAPQVSKPVAVRYAFKNWTGASLFDNYGLPASSFRTDNW